MANSIIKNGRGLYEIWAGDRADDVAFGVWDDLTNENQERWEHLTKAIQDAVFEKNVQVVVDWLLGKYWYHEAVELEAALRSGEFGGE